MKLKCECGSNGFLEVIRNIWAVDERGIRIQREPEKEELIGIYCVKCGKPATITKGEEDNGDPKKI